MKSTVLLLLGLAALPAGSPETWDRTRLAVLESGTGFLTFREERIPGGLGPQARARALVEALLRTPPERGGPFPAGTRVLHLFLAGDGALVLDLSAEALKVPPGASSESLAAQSLVLTLCSNLPGMNKVLIMVDGKKRETLSGHLGLLDPLEPLEALIMKKPEIQP